MCDINVSYYRSIKETIPSESVSMNYILTSIQNGTWKDIVLEARRDLTLKKSLPCFTPSGIFNRREKKQLISFSGLLCFDFDALSDVANFKSRVAQIPWIYAIFITPSGSGLKILVRTNIEIQNFQKTENHIAGLLYQEVGFQRDSRATGISQPQFISYDPDLYYRKDAEVFRV